MYIALIREGYMEVYKFFYKYILPWCANKLKGEEEWI